MDQIHLETKNLSYTYHDSTQALKNVNIKIMFKLTVKKSY